MEEKQKKFAVWSLVLGIVGLIFGCMFLGLPAAIIAIILGVRVLGVSRYNKERHMAVAGIITGAVGILFAVIMAVSVARTDPAPEVSADAATETECVVETETSAEPVELEQETEEAQSEIVSEQMETEQQTATEVVQEEASNEKASEKELEKPAQPEAVTNESTPEADGTQTQNDGAPAEYEVAVAAVSSGAAVAVDNSGSTGGNSDASGNGGQAVSNADSNPAPAPAPADSGSGVTVHITDTGSKYHSAGCQYLAKSDHEVSLETAKSMGLTPCSKCNSPRELFITPCRITPAQASPTPAKSPPKTRGMRTVFSRTQAVEEVSFAVRTAQISEKLRFTLPNRIPEQTETNKSRIKSIMIKKLRFLFMENSLF